MSSLNLQISDSPFYYLLNIDCTSVDENDLNVQIEILHLGWVLYSIALNLGGSINTISSARKTLTSVGLNQIHFQMLMMSYVAK